MKHEANSANSDIEWIDWVLAASFFVLVALLYWGLMAKSDALIGYIIPILACVVSFGVGGAYIAELISEAKKKPNK